MLAVGYLKTKGEMFHPYDYYRFKEMQYSVLVNKWEVPGRGGGRAEGGGGMEEMKRVYYPVV